MRIWSIFRRAAHWVPGVALALALALELSPLAAQAQTYTDLHNFAAGEPFAFYDGRLAQGRDGNFYAESNAGGTSNLGTIFKVTPSGTVTIIHSLIDREGKMPYGGLTLAPDGNFYGNAYYRGRGAILGSGTVFKVTPSGALKVLHVFANAGDGSNPAGALVVGNNGNLYGPTQGPAAFSPETIFQITPSGTFSTIATLDTGLLGYGGIQLTVGSDGNIYGGTVTGGANAGGTVFQVTSGGTVTLLHALDNVDGTDVNFGMVQAVNGEFYGAAVQGGASQQGTIYSVTSSGFFAVVYTLNGTTDGAQPAGQLFSASDGNLYGVTNLAGAANCGTIFQVAGGIYRVLYNFDHTHGCSPRDQLIQGTNGLLYGLAFGGTNDDGVFYSLDLRLPAFAGLVSPAGAQGGRLGILGQGFSKTSVVTFDGVPATSIAVEGGTFISAVIPPGALTGFVSVSTGSATLTSIRAFQVNPTFATFAPTSGPVSTPITITGTAFTQTTAVSLNGTAATFIVNSDTQITATVPNGATTGEISVTTKGGSALSTTTFTVN